MKQELRVGDSTIPITLRVDEAVSKLDLSAVTNAKYWIFLRTNSVGKTPDIIVDASVVSKVAGLRPGNGTSYFVATYTPTASQTAKSDVWRVAVLWSTDGGSTFPYRTVGETIVPVRPF